MFLATLSLLIGVSRGLGLPMNGSSFNSFGSLKCALKWSPMILQIALGSVTFLPALS